MDRVKEFLSDSYWASDRSKELIEKTIMNSFCYGVYHDEELVGFVRVVSCKVAENISRKYLDRKINERKTYSNC